MTTKFKRNLAARRRAARLQQCWDGYAGVHVCDLYQ